MAGRARPVPTVRCSPRSRAVPMDQGFPSTEEQQAAVAGAVHAITEQRTLSHVLQTHDMMRQSRRELFNCTLQKLPPTWKLMHTLSPTDGMTHLKTHWLPPKDLQVTIAKLQTTKLWCQRWFASGTRAPFFGGIYQHWGGIVTSCTPTLHHSSHSSKGWKSPWTYATAARQLASTPRNINSEDDDGAEESELEDEDGSEDFDIEDEEVEDGDEQDEEEEEKKKPAKPKVKSTEQQGTRINEEITARHVRLISDEGHKVVSREEALSYAKKQNFDLVQVDAKADPPVCKIFDYHRETYKKEQIQKDRRKQKGDAVRLNDVKELRFTSKTELKDLTMKVEKAKQFMDRGHRVKFVAVYKADAAQGELLDKIFPLVEDIAVIEQGPRVEARQAWVMLRHVKFGKIKKKPPKVQPQMVVAEQMEEDKGFQGSSSDPQLPQSSQGVQRPQMFPPPSQGSQGVRHPQMVLAEQMEEDKGFQGSPSNPQLPQSFQGVQIPQMLSPSQGSQGVRSPQMYPPPPAGRGFSPQNHQLHPLRPPVPPAFPSFPQRYPAPQQGLPFQRPGSYPPPQEGSQSEHSQGKYPLPLQGPEVLPHGFQRYAPPQRGPPSEQAQGRFPPPLQAPEGFAPQVPQTYPTPQPSSPSQHAQGRYPSTSQGPGGFPPLGPQRHPVPSPPQGPQRSQLQAPSQVLQAPSQVPQGYSPVQGPPKYPPSPYPQRYSAPQGPQEPFHPQLPPQGPQRLQVPSPRQGPQRSQLQAPPQVPQGYSPVQGPQRYSSPQEFQESSLLEHRQSYGPQQAPTQGHLRGMPPEALQRPSPPPIQGSPDAQGHFRYPPPDPQRFSQAPSQRAPWSSPQPPIYSPPAVSQTQPPAGHPPPSHYQGIPGQGFQRYSPPPQESQVIPSQDVQTYPQAKGPPGYSPQQGSPSPHSGPFPRPQGYPRLQQGPPLPQFAQFPRPQRYPPLQQGSPPSPQSSPFPRSQGYPPQQQGSPPPHFVPFPGPQGYPPLQDTEEFPPDKS